MKKNSFFIVLLGMVSFIGYEVWKDFHHKTPIAPKEPPLKMSLKEPIISIDNDTAKMLLNQAPNMQKDVINKVVTSIECANEKNLPHQSMLTVIDYSLPSNQKRLWVFDLNSKQLLYNTYVAHGIRSGSEFTTFFSNQYNSRASSIGIYKTKMNYLGREGTSLRLQGLEQGINDNAERRSIVMHGAFYVEEDFIKKYGRAGRSWGCPALPESLSKPIILTIKDDNLMVVYYPSEQWVTKSKFLNCHAYTPTPDFKVALRTPIPDVSVRDEVFFVSNAAKSYRAETPPVLVVSADYYIQRFQANAPLERMLRRRIDHQEYIALNKHELQLLAAEYNAYDLKSIFFVIPTLTNSHGYVQTVMTPVNLGTITALDTNNGYRVTVNHQQIIQLQPNNQFIRWLGL